MAAEVAGLLDLMDFKANVSSYQGLTLNGYVTLARMYHHYDSDCSIGFCHAFKFAKKLEKSVEIGCHSQRWKFCRNFVETR